MSRQRILDRTVLTGPRYTSPVPLYGDPCSGCSVPITEDEPIVVIPDQDAGRATDGHDVAYLKLHRGCAVRAGFVP